MKSNQEKGKISFVQRTSRIIARMTCVFGVCVMAQTALSKPSVSKRTYTWTKDHTTLSTLNVYGPDGFGAANNSNTSGWITVNPTVNLSVIAHYDVTGSDEALSWTAKFATKELYTYTYTKPITSFFLGAHKQVSYKIYYVAERGDEQWNGVQVSGGAG